MAWVLKMDDATIESGLVHDFDASLSGIGQELGAGAYSMRLETESSFIIKQLVVGKNHIHSYLEVTPLMPVCVISFVPSVMASLLFWK